MHRKGVENDIIWANVGTKPFKITPQLIDFQLSKKIFPEYFVCLNI
jgi:hypothetical protein